AAAVDDVFGPGFPAVRGHHHGRAAPDPVTALHEDQAAAFGPAFGRGDDAPAASAVVRLGDATRLVGGLTAAVRRHHDVLVSRGIELHVFHEAIVRHVVVLRAGEHVGPADAAVRRLPQALCSVAGGCVEHALLDRIDLHAPLRAVADAAERHAVADAARPRVHLRKGRAAV